MTPSKEQELIRLREENQRQQQAISELQQRLTEAIEGNKELKEQLTNLQDRLDRVLFQLEKRNKKEFGKKTEKHNPRQGSTTDEESKAATSGVSQTTPKKKNENHKKNIHLQNLPSQPVNHVVPQEERICPTCLIDTKPVSEKITNQLERLRHSLVRLEHHQEVRSCPKCKQYVITAKKPDPPFPGSLAGSHLLSSIIVDKLADGLPNYRQQKRFKREQAIIPRSTQCDWIIASSFTLLPLYELLIRRVLSSKIVKTDDTWVKVQDRTLPDNIRKGKMTPYLGDKTNPFTVFDFSPTLSFDRNKEFLKSFTGFVQADASNGFDALFKDGTKVEVGCSAHSRRKADEAKDAEPKDCEEILDIYTKLYKIEEKIKGKEPEVRLLERRTKSKPLVLTLHEKLLVLQKSLNPTNPLREYVDYTLRHWIALTRFVDDPDFDVDNNDTERTIKMFVLMRKNALFFGSDAGGRAAAIHLSIIASCERNDVDPLAYLTDVFKRINSMKVSELDQLLPNRWVPLPTPPP